MMNYNTRFWYTDSNGAQQTAYAHTTADEWSWSRQFNQSVGRKGMVSYPIRRVQAPIQASFAFESREDKYTFVNWVRGWQTDITYNTYASDEFPYLKMFVDINGDGSKGLYYGVIIEQITYDEYIDDVVPKLTLSLTIAKDNEDASSGDWSWTNIPDKAVTATTVKASGDGAFE